MSSRGHASDKMKYVPDSLRWLIAITGVLIVIGCLNIYSSTYYMDIYDGGSAYKHISNHILFLLGGIFAAWIAVKLGTNKIRQGAWLWFIAVFLLLILVKFAGISVNGANRWIMLGPISLQPSELAKVAGIIWTAAFLAKRINNKEPITVFYGILNRPSRRCTVHRCTGYRRGCAPPSASGAGRCRHRRCAKTAGWQWSAGHYPRFSSS